MIYVSHVSTSYFKNIEGFQFGTETLIVVLFQKDWWNDGSKETKKLTLSLDSFKKSFFKGKKKTLLQIYFLIVIESGSIVPQKWRLGKFLHKVQRKTDFFDKTVLSYNTSPNTIWDCWLTQHNFVLGISWSNETVKVKTAKKSSIILCSYFYSYWSFPFFHRWKKR